MKKVEIENLKSIRKLQFDIPDRKGVYLIAGANGCGKTTLLVCLDRIANKHAFSNGFSKTSSWDMADQYKDAKVRYIVDEERVEYQKKQARWVPTPKRSGQEILNQFGFSKSIFIRADSRRIDVKSEDLRSGNLTSVDKSIKESLNLIFDTKKYDNLQRLKNTNGRGRSAIYFYVFKEGKGDHVRYYSEKRFSTGELAMLRLIEQVESLDEKTIILLDEAELALHPRVQVRLLEYLREKANEKNLWVFISTHSPTMLKASSKEEILLLREGNASTKIITPCYPAQAIGEVDFLGSNIFDYIFFVEDDKARCVLLRMIRRYLREFPSHATAMYNIIPVGGYFQTAQLAVNTYKRVFGNSQVFAVLDQDAFYERSEKDPKNESGFKKIYKSNKGMIKSLTFIPEVWIIDKIEENAEGFKKEIIDEYSADLNDILQSSTYKSFKCDNPKKLAKKKLDFLIEQLSVSSSGRDENIIEDELIRMIVEDMDIREIKKVLNPLFNRKS